MRTGATPAVRTERRCGVPCQARETRASDAPSDVTIVADSERLEFEPVPSVRSGEPENSLPERTFGERAAAATRGGGGLARQELVRMMGRHSYTC